MCFIAKIQTWKPHTYESKSFMAELYKWIKNSQSSTDELLIGVRSSLLLHQQIAQV